MSASFSRSIYFIFPSPSQKEDTAPRGNSFKLLVTAISLHKHALIHNYLEGKKEQVCVHTHNEMLSLTTMIWRLANP